MVRPALALLVLLSGLAAPARAAGLEGGLRLSGGALVDSNAPRDFTDAQGGGDPEADVGLHLLVGADGRYGTERYQLVGRYDAGARAYQRFGSESTLVQAATLEGSHALGRFFGVGLEGRAKDRRGGSRTYTDLAAGAFLEYVPDARLDVRLRAGAHRFLYWPAFRSSFGAPEVGVHGRLRLSRRHALTVFGEWGQRRHGVAAQPPPGAPARGRREDTALSAGVGYSLRGPLALSAGYAYQEVVSNSFGETVQRHRLSAAVGVRLPWRLTLLAQGTLALNRYPDGVFLSPELILAQDDEGQNVLSLRLVRPLSQRLDLELSFGLQGTRLPRNDLSYSRQTGGLGFSWRL